MNTNAVNFSIDLDTTLDASAIRNSFDTASPSLCEYKTLITQLDAQLDQLFLENNDIVKIIRYRAHFFDALLQHLWSNIQHPQHEALSLIAVGGYGRGELHPFSDIDILILSEENCGQKSQESISELITFLWDLGLTIGQSVRTLKECIDIAKDDVTVITNLIESRLLCGNAALFQQLHDAINQQDFWPSPKFFIAKHQEQINRHRNFNNSEYNLEPNIKECAGGLRDIQMVHWIINRHTLTHDIKELVNLEFLTQEEFITLIAGRNFLWEVRYAMHIHFQRGEDRLLFEAQKVLADIFGFKDNEQKLAIEQFMQQYYRWSMQLGGLNEMLIQLFSEEIIKTPQKKITINSKFILVDDFLDAISHDVFSADSSTLLEVFVHCAERETIKGIRAQTIRSIRQNLDKIDEAFRQDPVNHQLFLQLLQSPHRVGFSLKLMQRFGVLGAYIPAFGKIVGQTQHDLFHIYTVDAHTIQLTLNIDNFINSSAEKKWPIVHEIVHNIERRELLYLAAIFHDIAKGRGGDHSTLGAVDAFEFCRAHGLGQRDSNLVSWLVEKHLLISSTAQRKDIDDPEVIREFALQMGDQIHLNYLFALTVADINATNKNLWNAWRASLLRKLYKNTQRALRRGLAHYLDRENWLAEKQQQALSELQQSGFNPEEVRRIWDEPNNDYFLLETTNNIVRHTLDIQAHQSSANAQQPLITLYHPKQNKVGASEIFIHMPAHNNLFAVITAVLEQLDLNVHDVRTYSTRSNHTIDSYYVLNSNNEPLDTSAERRQQILNALHEELANPEEFANIIQRRTPRQLKYFALPTTTHMSIDPIRQCNILEVSSPDRPGLLARIARVFIDFKIDLLNAKISTLGEMVEDIFFISDQNGKIIDNPEVCTAIQQAIRDKFDQQNDSQQTSAQVSSMSQ